MVEEVGILVDGELDFLFFGEKLVDVPIAHINIFWRV